MPQLTVINADSVAPTPVAYNLQRWAGIMSLKKRKKKVHLVGLHSKLTDVHAKKAPPLHFPPQWMQLAPSGWVGEETCLVQTWPTQHVVCLALKSCYEAGASGGMAGVCVQTETWYQPKPSQARPPLVPVQLSGRDGQMCSDRSLLLSLSTCPSASIVPGCQGAEWRLLSGAQV